MGWKFVLELQYWFNSTIINRFVNKDGIKFPPTTSENDLIPCSFIELLFNDDYNCESYKYLFEKSVNSLTWPSLIRSRLKLYPQTISYWYPNVTGTNLFNLRSEDLTLLDALLDYRKCQDSTAFIIITDTTSVEFISDSTSYTLYANIDILPTNLSKLIFTYLDFKVNQIYSRYDNEILIANTNNILELYYETYVLDEIFSFISNRQGD